MKAITLKEFIEKTNNCNLEEFGWIRRPECEFADGVKISIQASSFHYNSPRDNGGVYTHFELGYPSIEINELIEYAECKSDLTQTVYAQVPFDVLNSLVEKHGGIINEL